MENDDINFNMNMTYLLNKQYNIHHTSKNIEKNNIDNKDKKFYKKRILDISKKIINNELLNNEINQPIIDSFHEFARVCINHFKTIDVNDEMQEKLINVSNSSKKKVSFEDDNKKINNMLFKKNNKEHTLDSFVIKEKNKDENYILPKQNDINIYNVKNKRKNIKKKQKKMSIYTNENQKEKD
tara:strand:+ start:6236 stop:6784 length:549 start_codon:yes stop_codon:yes gene_type:complete